MMMENKGLAWFEKGLALFAKWKETPFSQVIASFDSTICVQMNTAARMESNGVRGRIHVSETTRDELVAKGKGSWVTAREDKIVAKGKGEMQTYFVTPSYRAGSNNQPSSSFSDESSAVSGEALGHEEVDPAMVDRVAAELDREESGPSAVCEDVLASLKALDKALGHDKVDSATVDCVAAELKREESALVAI